MTFPQKRFVQDFTRRLRGNHRKRKVVKPAGVNAVVLLVRMVEGTAGVGVTDSDGGRAGLLRA
jgi:hypothetical protein